MDAPEGKSARTVRIGEKGQIVIAKAALDMFNITPGDTLLLFADDTRGIAIVRREPCAEFTDSVLRTMGTPVEPEG
jgi:AbrB family looped-hinge helix DNA binding protein